MRHLRILETLWLALLLTGCAPRSARRQVQIAATDAGDPASDATRASEDGPDTGSFGSTDASPQDRIAILDQAPEVTDAAAPDLAARPDVAPPDQAVDARPMRALMVVANPGTLGTDDQRIRTLLQSKNINVTLGDDDGNATQANGMDLVVISGSVVSTTVGTKYQTTAIPVLCLEAFSYGNMRMTGPVNGTDFFSVDTVDIAIVLGTHPLAAGFPAGNLTVNTAPTLAGWGVVPATAESIATVVGMPAQSVIFSYEPGRIMAGLAAPARRVGFFPISPSPDLLNAAGLRLLGAAIDWITRP